MPDRSVVIWGARTLAGGVTAASDYRYVPVRRLMLLIEGSLQAGLAWTVFEPNEERTWAIVRASVENFLFDLWKAGALMGAKPSEAFFVHCDRSTMTQGDVGAGRLVVQLGIAPLKPAEFVVIDLLFRTVD